MKNKKLNLLFFITLTISLNQIYASECHKIQSKTICFKSNKVGNNDIEVSNLTLKNKINMRAEKDLVEHICSNFFSLSDYKKIQSSTALTYYTYKGDRIGRNRFFNEKVINKFTCSGVKILNKERFLSDSKKMAINIFNDSFSRLSKKYANESLLMEKIKERLLSLEFEDGEILDHISPSTFAYVTGSSIHRERGKVFITHNFFTTPLVIAAGHLIHEATHLSGVRDECKAERITINAFNFSIKSTGLLPGGYLDKCYRKHDLCGSPIILKVDNGTNDLAFILRSKNWVGGTSICDKKYRMDLNTASILDYSSLLSDNLMNFEDWNLKLQNEFVESSEFISTEEELN